LSQLRRRAIAPTEARTQVVNYRHAYHAGNFADVVKHIALVAALLHLRKKEKGFRVVDTHAGRGLYDLKSAEAQRTREAESGVGRFTGSADLRVRFPSYIRETRSEPRGPYGSAPGVWIDCVAAEGEGMYPGSPRLIARLLRPKDRLIAIENHPEECAALAHALAPFPNAQTICADGYERLPALLPPPERRGLVLIDPPYEADDEFTRAAQLLAAAHRRFATGILMLWFPMKSKAHADALCGEVLAHGIARLLRIDTDIGIAPDESRLTAAGLLVVNPPYGFAEEMRDAAIVVDPLLSNGSRAARVTVNDLAAA